MAGRGGARKGAGRKKGGTNKSTQNVRDMLAAKGVDPVEAMADCLLDALEEGNRPEIMMIAEKLAPYHSPKLTASKIEAEVVGLTYEDKLTLLDK